jgi:hypothetical protein
MAAGVESRHDERRRKEPAMRALTELFTTDVGLLSFGAIAFMLGMGVFYVIYFVRHVRRDAERQQRRAADAAKAAR